MSFSADSSGFGEAYSGGTAIWNDNMTVGGLTPGAPVTLLAELDVEVAYTSMGFSSGHLSACFGGSSFEVCTEFRQDFDGNVICRRRRARSSNAHVGDVIHWEDEWMDLSPRTICSIPAATAALPLRRRTPRTSRSRR
jgi:hypothetical protein